MGAAALHHGKAPAAQRQTRLPLAQLVLLAAILLLGLSWGTQRAPSAVRPTTPGQYVTDLLLPLDVGTLEQQEEADAWCAAKPQLSWPPTKEELRTMRVAIVLEPVCARQEAMPADKLATCMDKIVSHCKDLAKTGCFGGWSNKIEECEDVTPWDVFPDGTKPPKRWGDYQNWWQTIMTKITPEMRGMGWQNLKILSDPKSASERRMAHCADVLVTSTTMFWQLYPFKHNMRPHQKLILIEQYGAGTFMIPEDMEEGVESNRTLAVVKHVIVDPPSSQNGPFLEERAHLALMAPQVENGERLLTMRERPWSQAALDKMVALLPMTVRFSNSIQCGGSWSFARFHGFFTKNHNRWPIPPLAERQYDVTFIGKLEYEAKAEVSGVTLHRQAAVKALSAFRDKWSHKYKFYVPQGERLEYHEYIELLKNSKIVVSPWGWGEWSHKDFEILMAGCVTVKPRADIFKIHPPIFEHNVTAISVKEDLSDLEQQVLPFLQDLPRAQEMATRVQGLWRKYARAEVLAADWDNLLVQKLGDAVKAEAQLYYQGQGPATAADEAPEQQHEAELSPAAEARMQQQHMGAAEAARQAQAAAEEEPADEAGGGQQQQQQQQEQQKPQQPGGGQDSKAPAADQRRAR